eukprot:m.90516 g.90516  ORF g.90516 m.90516 type:complete len:394 (+) comp18169_c0_seq2:50-1231(+)
MRCRRRSTCLFILAAAWTGVLLLFWHRTDRDDLSLQPPPPPLHALPPVSLEVGRPLRVEVWGKAAITDYLWQHIINGTTEARLGGLWTFGLAQFGRVTLTLRTGYGVQPSKVPQDTELVILVLNAHNDEKQPGALVWLELLRQLPRLRHAGIVLLAREDCSNNWLRQYVDDPRYKIRFVFMTYGQADLLDDKKYLQWPLGVATYRHFPRGVAGGAALQAHRPYLANLLATVYPGSSREELVGVLKSSPSGDIFIKTRADWVPKEDASREYMQTLLGSHHTLCPAGLNTECYRWFEALACGSIPIVEDVIQPATCTHDPLRLMKHFHAPFLYVRKWTELPALLAKRRALAPEQQQKEREHAVAWYEWFKQQMRQRFLEVLAYHFDAYPAQEMPA